MSRTGITGGRELLRGVLLHRKKGSSSWKRRGVMVFCGSESGDKRNSACLALYEDYEKIGEKKPKKVIQLVGAKIEEPAVVTPVGSHGTPPSSSSIQSEKTHQFMVILSSEVSEFRADCESTKLHWMKLLTLLTMFPHSVIPPEPTSNPISESFRYKLDAKAYGADSAWAVYIMPEEVGSKCHMIGIHILLLRGGVPHKSVGRLEIINPTDSAKPIVVWDRDKMRRTGKTGNLVFIEIGRRCQGGPGLLWMYAGFQEAHSLRETLHRFLFQGDGKAVSIPTHDSSSGGIYSRPRTSVDSSLPSSYQKEQSVSYGYQYHQMPSRREDSGFTESPISQSISPALTGPPVRLDKHPSFRKQRSLPCHVPRRAGSVCSSSPSGSYDRDPSLSYGHSVGSFNDEEMFDERVASRQSVSPPDEGYSETDESGSGQFNMDLEHAVLARRNTEPLQASARAPLPQRSNTAPSSTREYEKMTHPNAPMYQDGYVMMVPVGGPPSGAGGETVQRPTVPSHYDVPAAFRKKQVSNGDASLTTSPSPSKYENCGPLPTIDEAPRRRERSDVYENFPRPAEVEKEGFVNYHPDYENMDVFTAQRRASRSSESYENISLDESSEGKGRSVDKDSLLHPRDSASPPNGMMHFPYAKLHSANPSNPPPIPPRIPVAHNAAT